MEPDEEITSEIEQLNSEDPTPEVGRKQYTHSKQYFQKKLAEQQREDRAKARLEGATTRDWISEHRAERLALFEDEPLHVAESLEGMLSSARLFAKLLREDDVRPGESLIGFCTRIFLRWSQGVVIGGILPCTYRFPLVEMDLGDGTQAQFSLFGGWPPDNTGKILVDEPQLPVWPVGADAMLDLKRLPPLLGEEERRQARLRMQMAQARRHEEPRTIVWTLNRVTGYQEPRPVFVRLSHQEELLRYRLGYRYFAGEFPELRPDKALADISIRARTEDLQSLIEQDYARAVEEIKGRQQ